MNKVLLSLSLVGMFFLASCGGNAITVETTDAQEESVASMEAETFAVDTNVSSATWRGFKFFHDASKPEEGHYGPIKLKSGELLLSEGVLESGKLVADLNTLESADLADNAKSKGDLEGHLKSADFLDVEKFPEATFVITDVKALAEGDYNTEISGNLDFRGIPKNITFKANVKHEGDNVSLQSEEIVINRQDFGMNFVGGGESVIKDEVVLQLDIKANKA
ncbi:MAG TPA: YceI family protein [Moheibacter sp.]|nr:YceI family protein [Moheibacter sp.]